MKTLNKGSIILVIFLAICLGLLINAYIVQSEKFDRVFSNQNELLEANKKDRQLMLTLQEANERDSSMIASVSDKLNIKPKQITNVQNIYNTFIDSSNHYIQGVKTNDTNVFIDFTKDPCWGFNGNFNLSTYRFTLGLRYFNDTTRIVDYWKRNRIFNAKYFWPRWGSKKYFRESYSKCGEDIKTEEITIKKR